MSDILLFTVIFIPCLGFMFFIMNKAFGYETDALLLKYKEKDKEFRKKWNIPEDDERPNLRENDI